MSPSSEMQVSSFANMDGSIPAICPSESCFDWEATGSTGKENEIFLAFGDCTVSVVSLLHKTNKTRGKWFIFFIFIPLHSSSYTYSTPKMYKKPEYYVFIELLLVFLLESCLRRTSVRNRKDVPKNTVIAAK